MCDNTAIKQVEYENIDIEKVCRLCLCENTNMQHLFEDDFAQHLRELACVNLNENDELPKVLCDSCAFEVNKWYKFKLKIIKSESILRCIIANRKNENAEAEVSPEDTSDIKAENDTDIDSDRLHCTAKIHQCAICKKELKTTHSLKRHMKIHSGVKPHVCHLCNQKFVEAGNLAKHLRKHTNDKKHKCNECGLCFFERNKLQIHMRKHTGEKPYKCRVCCRAFPTASQVQRHMKVI